MSGDLEPFEGGAYFGSGGRTSFGGHGQYVRSRPVGLKVIAGITTAQWIGRRLATRLTPIFLLFLFLIGIPLAFWSNDELIIALGAGLTVITYATQRHVSKNEKVNRQWAIRTAALPITGTGWILGWRHMHLNHMDVVNEHMIVAFWLYGCVTWAWLHVAHFVGRKVAWERAQRDFAPVAQHVGVAGAAIVKSAKTRVGTKRILDVRGTGKTASAIAKDGALAEQLAASAGMAPGKVRVSASPTHAGYVEVSEWTVNPWVKPLTHPGAPNFPRKGRNLAGPFTIGADPETDQSLQIELINQDGGIHWVFIAGTRGGKTNLINNIVEHLTDCLDSKGRSIVQVTMIDMIKGMKDAANWAPAVKAVYGGPKAVHGALGALQRAVDLIATRAAENGRRGRSKHVPTADEPAEVIIIDEASSLLNKGTPEGRRAVALVERIMQSGASELVILIIAAQRGVLQHLGGGDVKANAFGVVVLPVKRGIEQTNIISDWRDRGMPDMSKYGDGAKGTALITVNDAWSVGRTFEMHDMMVIRKIAIARCLPGNESMIQKAQQIDDPLVVEPPADGVDGPDFADLDFDAQPDAPDVPDVRTPDRPSGRPGDRPDVSGQPVARPDMPPELLRLAWENAAPGSVIHALRSSGLSPDDRRVQEVFRAVAELLPQDAPDGVHLTGEDAEDDEAADRAVDASVQNVRTLHPDALRWEDADMIDTDDDEDDDMIDEEGGGSPAIEAMAESVDRMLNVTEWAAEREAARTPEERQELVDAWRQHSWALDQEEELPGPVNACLSALAKARGMKGFTLRDAKSALHSTESTPDSVPACLRILTNQGHLERLRGVGPAGADIYRIGERHRRRSAQG